MMPVDAESIFDALERDRASGALARAIREANGDQPVYGLVSQGGKDRIMAYYPDGRVEPYEVQGDLSGVQGEDGSGE